MMEQAVETIGFVNPWSWYPVAASADLDPGALLPVRLGGEELVVWRAADGAARAWSTRCPHRGMRLTLGSVSGESLICPYHGWTFDGEGYCTHIPAHPDIAPSRAARVRLFPAQERDGYIWAALGEPSAAVPDTGALAEAGLVHLRSIAIAAEPATVFAALLALPLPLAPFADGAARTAWLAMAEAGLVTEAGGATLRATVGEGRALCVLALPALLEASFTDGADSRHFAVLLQPAASGAVVLHLALDAQAPIAARQRMNAALVQLRRDLTEPADQRTWTEGVARLRARLALAVPNVTGIAGEEETI